MGEPSELAERLRAQLDPIDHRRAARAAATRSSQSGMAGTPSDERRPNIGLGAGVLQPHAGQDYAPVAG
ncbi:hypothetical protein ABZU32_15685 [Sphaerisporangium sp. NPDC005288]|uniref:hypothetical protein n=1 Tax=Sphaerisporangium sp. NPDC005288 TaxID=3155114 RepID=UPI0033B97C82